MKKTLKLIVLITIITSCGPDRPPISEAELNRKVDSTMKAQEMKAQEEQAKKYTVWNYSSSTDEMTSQETKVAEVVSSNHFNLDFPYQGGTWGNLIVRLKGEGLDVYFVTTNGQISTDYRNPSFRVRFDNEDPFYTSVSESTANDNNIRFFNKPKQLFDLIKSHKKMKIEVVFYNQGTYVFEFNIANLKL